MGNIQKQNFALRGENWSRIARNFPHAFRKKLVSMRVVAGIFDNGKLDIRTASGKIRVRFPLDMIPFVQRFQIATPAKVRVQTTRFSDTVTKREVFKYQMLPSDK